MTPIYRMAATVALAFTTSNMVAAIPSSAAQQSVKVPFRLLSEKPTTITDAAMASAEKTETPGKVFADKKSLLFTQRRIRLVVHTGPDNDMLSYRIEGLRNPTLVVPRASTLKVLFVNTDDDMFHNIRFGQKPSEFQNASDSLLKSSVGAPPLQHVDGKTLHASELIIKTPNQVGRYAYFCTVRGHAQGGMWGTLQVR